MSFFGNLIRKLRPAEDKPKRVSLPSSVVQGVDPYTLWQNVSELGDGAFGKVYKASHVKTGLLAALKSVEFSSDEEMEDLMVEVDILNECKHPNILKLHEAYIFDGKIWMYLEFCGGGAVDSIMKALDKPLTEPQIRFISHEVLSGLAFLHAHLIIHRDLKAGNILITSNNEIRLADFGVSARMANENQKRSTFIGTPYWMAPEVIACETFKENPYGTAADVWSFGITLIEFAEMLPPYNELNPTRVLLKITKSDPPSFSKPKAWSLSLNNFLRRCLRKDPDQRPTMSELQNDPFVSDVTEADRAVIKILLGEVNADVEEIVEDITPDDLPNFDVDMVSSETVEVLPHSLQSTGDIEEKLSIGDVLMTMVSYEDVEFSSEDPRISSPSPAFFISTDENLSVQDKVVRSIADSFIRDLLLDDLDLTSLGFIAFECIKECQECSEQGTSHLQTSFGADSTLARGVKDPGSSTPISLPDFAIEVSRCDEEDEPTKMSGSLLETRELPPEETMSADSGNKDNDLHASGKYPVEVASALRKPNRFRASIRTRRFIVDGKEHTTTSKRVILNEKAVRPAENSVARLRALRDFRELAKESKRRNREIAERVEQQMRQLEAKQASEFTQLHRALVRDLEAAAKRYKASSDRLEAQLEGEIKAVRDANTQSEKAFLEQFKHKLERRINSRTQRKTIMRDIRDYFNGVSSDLQAPTDASLVVAECYTEAVDFFRHQEDNLGVQIPQLKNMYEKKMAHLDLQLQSEQYELNMNFTKEQGKMEQLHMHMRHQLTRSQLKDFALADRQLLAKRLASQLLELREVADADRERLHESQMLEKKIFVKNERAARKRRMALYHKRLREDGVPNGLSMKEALAQMDETEHVRASDALHRLDKHHQMQSQALERELMARFVELDEQQSEKKTILANQESNRLAELDDEHKQEMKAHAECLHRKILQLREKYEKEIIGRADATSLKRYPQDLSPEKNNRDFGAKYTTLPANPERREVPSAVNKGPTQSFRC